MAQAHVLDKLKKFIGRTDWSDTLQDVISEHMNRPCRDMGLEIDEALSALNETHVANLYGCAFEDFLTRTYDGGRNVLDEYLKRRGYSESPGAQRYMRALRQSIMSLYEVSDIVPGESFLARDLIRGGEPVRVQEVSGSQMLKPWTRIAARIILQGTDFRMAGGVLVFKREISDYLIGMMTGSKDKLPAEMLALLESEADAEMLAEIDSALTHRIPLEEMAPTFTYVWLMDALDNLLNPNLPSLMNGDGHPVVLCTSTFRIDKGAKMTECRAALAKIPEFVRSGRQTFDWVRLEDADPPHEIPHSPEHAFFLKTITEQDQNCLGSIEVRRTAVVLSTDSRERADEGEAAVRAALGDLVGEPAREERTLTDMLSENEMEKSEVSKLKDDLPPEIVQHSIHRYLDRYYAEILHEPVAALGNMSPHEAAKSEAMRAKLIDWLKDMEHSAAKLKDVQGSIAHYDFRWIWRELGIEEWRV